MSSPSTKLFLAVVGVVSASSGEVELTLSPEAAGISSESSIGSCAGAGGAGAGASSLVAAGVVGGLYCLGN